MPMGGVFVDGVQVSVIENNEAHITVSKKQRQISVQAPSDLLQTTTQRIYGDQERDFAYTNYRARGNKAILSYITGSNDTGYKISYREYLSNMAIDEYYVYDTFINYQDVKTARSNPDPVLIDDLYGNEREIVMNVIEQSHITEGREYKGTSSDLNRSNLPYDVAWNKSDAYVYISTSCPSPGKVGSGDLASYEYDKYEKSLDVVINGIKTGTPSYSVDDPQLHVILHFYVYIDNDTSSTRIQLISDFESDNGYICSRLG